MSNASISEQDEFFTKGYTYGMEESRRIGYYVFTLWNVICYATLYCAALFAEDARSPTSKYYTVSNLFN